MTNDLAWTPLDEEVAERVMGWRLEPLSDPKWKGFWPAWPRSTRMRIEWIRRDAVGSSCVASSWDPRPIPRFSSDLPSAMLVLDKMRELGHRWLLNIDTEGFHLRRVALVKFDQARDEKSYTCDRPLGWAKTLGELPKIICLAAFQEIKETK